MDSDDLDGHVHQFLTHSHPSLSLGLLVPEVKITEGGHTQSRDEYAAGHLYEDIAFLKGAKLKTVSMGSMPMGDTAMVGTETEITTTRDGKSMTIRSREMLDLKRDGSNWRIIGVRWQSISAGTMEK